MGQPFRRKRHRLPDDCYRQPATVHFTLCTAGRRPWFSDDRTTATVSDLIRAAIVEPLALEAYCFMPDHLHLLITNSGGGDVRDAVTRCKQHSGYAHRRRTGHPLWQAGFHDHVLRREEDLIATIRYILGNPVRQGWCDDWRAWPWSWSRWPIDEE